VARGLSANANGLRTTSFAIVAVTVPTPPTTWTKPVPTSSTLSKKKKLVV
tara:strand:+ start:38 stop:187 length:150 start_codon:yes stop_codon:yes gene_type:complete